MSIQVSAWVIPVLFIIFACGAEVYESPRSEEYGGLYLATSVIFTIGFMVGHIFS